uniref:DNL-type domain-containing protein n=1 Tax=Oryza nivara TaxID=4536 RepID=A0A0E0HVN8_ORYNI
MESVAIATTSRSLLPLPPFSSNRRCRRRASFLPVAATNRTFLRASISSAFAGAHVSRRHHDDDDEEVAKAHEPTSLASYGLSISPLSKDAAMGLVVSAATGRGWTTGSGMEGPPKAAGGGDRPEVSTLPWSLFTKSPRRRMRVAFTCNVCGQRTTRAINPHAYTDGTVFVQCCGCNIFHKLVDNLNLFHEMKCYVGPDFRYEGDAPFNYLDRGEDGDNIFPIL